MKTNTVKSYFRYLVTSNRRILILIWACMFIAVPFITGLTFINNPLSTYQNIEMFIAGSAVLCSIGISILLPVYLYHFLYRKQSCDLYFSIPITRKNLFLVTTLFSYTMVLLPMAVFYLGTSIISIAIYSAGLSAWLRMLCLLCVIAFFILCMQAIILFICVRSNNLVDAMFLIASYLILPILLYVTMNIFLSSHIDLIMAGFGNYFEQLPLSMIFTTYLFLPSACLFAINDIAMQDPNVLQLCYWIVITAILLYVTYHDFLKRKAESSEQRTTTWVGYPLIIIVSIFCMILAVQTLEGITLLIFTTIIFLMYLFLDFFSKRRIALKMQTVVIFVILFIGSAGFGRLFEDTKGFGLLYELPSLNQIQGVTVTIDLWGGIEKDGKTYSRYELFGEKANQKQLHEEIYRVHEMAVENAQGKPKDTEMNGQFYVDYEMKDGSTVIRSYTIDALQYHDKYQAIFDQIEQEGKEGKYDIITNYDTQGYEE